MKLNKVKGFTLGEVIIVLLLTSIVVGMAFSVLNMVQRQMSSIQKNYSFQMGKRKLENSLNLDFNRHSLVSYDKSLERLVFISELDTTAYQINKSEVVKNQDTLNIEVITLNCFLKGESVLEGNIDAIKITLGKEFINNEIFVFKYNDSATFMN